MWHYFCGSACVSCNDIDWLALGDRQPYLTQSGVVDGYTAAEKCGYADASIVKAHDTITHNFFINGYNGELG